MLAASLACLLTMAGGASALVTRDFDHPADHSAADAQQQFVPASAQRRDTPNDPDYDHAEADDEDGADSTNIYDERFDLFGFPSLLTQTSAVYRDGPNAGKPMISGYNAAGAWKLERGRPDAVIAILDTGIKWDRGSLRLRIHLNRGELPAPERADGTTCTDYDCNGDGALNVADYAADPRVNPGAGPNGSAAVDGQDLIRTFSDGTDADGNGFVDDIAGWDFFDNDNDPYDASSYFAAGNHGSGRAADAAEEGNDGSGGLGVCPRCQIMPIRIWDTFVSDGNTFAMGILYGTDNGAVVIEGANGSTYHSAFAEAASQYAYDQGVVQTYSGDDLNTGNHNYPANYGHAMLIQGTVPDSVGLGGCPSGDIPGCDDFFGFLGQNGIPTSAPLGTYFRGANTTQYGGKSSISMEGATGSVNTGKASGAAALVISAARDASPSVQLRPDETRSILEQTAERVTSGNTIGTGTPDPGADASTPREDQWTSHFGWGRVNLGAAVALAQSRKIPPEAAIDSPDWYAPVTGKTIPVTGLARARFATGGQFHWKLEWGVGEAPTSWHTVGQGDSASAVTDLGTIDLDQVRQALQGFAPPPDSGGPVFSPTSPNPYKNEFTVRLTVTGKDLATAGIDRRVLTSAADGSLRKGFPKRMGTGGEAPIRYADINGDNVQELIVPTEDGVIHAYEPDGSELSGWPVRTRIEKSAHGHDSAPGFAALAAGTPPREPPRAAAIADLDRDGRPEVINTAGTHLYVWEPNGNLRPGFPVESNLDFCDPSLESQPLHHPKCGFASSPATAHLRGRTQPLDIVVPSLDGHLYAFDGEGNALPGFPVQLVDPGVPASDQMIAESINEPAIGDLNGDGKDDVVVATNETYDPQGPSEGDIPGGFGQGLTEILANAAGGSSRVYAVNGADGKFLSGWPVKLNGAIQDTLPFIGPGQNPALVKIGGEQRVVLSTTGSTTIGVYDTGGNLVRGVEQGVYGPGSDATDRSGTVNLFESVSIGQLLPAGGPAIVKYGLSLSDLANLLLVGQNVPYNHLIGAYDPQSGAPLPAFPRITDDFQFLSASDIARVDSDLPTNQVVAGTGLGLLHAYDGTTGIDVPGFPKVTGGWLFAPAAFSEDKRMADITREGFLFQWDLPGLPRCQSEWPSFRHDQQQTGNYDADGTPPSAPESLAGDEQKLSFDAPGDDSRCGTADHYEIVTSDSPVGPTDFAAARKLADPPKPKPAGTRQTYSLPSHDRYVAIRAVDEAGNIGWDAWLDTATGTTGGGGGNAGGGNGGGGGPQGGPCANRIAGTKAADRLRGTAAGDRLIGGRGPDRLFGFKGADCLRGNGGRDVLRGGKGADKLLGGIDQDRLYARDGTRDLVVCGKGRHDVAFVDRRDRVVGCERVRRH